MKIEWTASPNFSSRQGRKPEAIVNHITAGNFPGCRDWLMNPEAKASAHYVVNRVGEIYQLVADEDAAWHAGGVSQPDWTLYDGTNPNRYTIGIEHEGFDGTLTEEQYQSTLWLHRQLIGKWEIPVDRDHIFGHYRIDSVDRPNCPGPNFPWDRLFNDLLGSVDELAKSIEVLQAADIINDPGYWLENARPGKQADGEYVGIMIQRMAKKIKGAQKCKK